MEFVSRKLHPNQPLSNFPLGFEHSEMTCTSEINMSSPLYLWTQQDRSRTPSTPIWSSRLRFKENFRDKKRNPHRTGLMRCRLIAVSPMRILQAPSRVLEEALRRLRSGTSFAFAPLLDLRGIPSPPFPPPNVRESARVVQCHLTELHECSCAPDFPFRGGQRQGYPWLVDCSWSSKGPR